MILNLKAELQHSVYELKASLIRLLEATGMGSTFLRHRSANMDWLISFYLLMGSMLRHNFFTRPAGLLPPNTSVTPKEQVLMDQVAVLTDRLERLETENALLKVYGSGR